MKRLTIAILGPPMVVLDGKQVETDRHKAIGLLAYLATEHTPHKRASLAALLWPDYPQASAMAYLRRTLWELKRVLGKDWIEAERENVSLAHSPEIDIDLENFQRLLDQGKMVDSLREAVSLVRGEFLQGLVIADTAPYEAWQLQQAEYLRRELARALEMLVTALEQNGKYEPALPYAERWLALDRLNESAHRGVMRVLAGMGERSGAIRAYQACAQTLQDELGITPQEETQALYQSILHGEYPAIRPDDDKKGPEAIPGRAAGNLPTPTTRFIGRDEELEQIRKLTLDPHIHLVTLTGPGGTGKTRLAIQAARQVEADFNDGAWFIPLAAVQAETGLVQAVARGLEYTFFTGHETPRQQLLDYLREKRLLLVLDNFEQLVAAGRGLVSDILNNAPGVKLLVTSRQRLDMQAEQVFRVMGMRTPGERTVTEMVESPQLVKRYSAIQLLQERARRLNPDFEVTHENLEAVVQICRLVDGSPLGIELAVDWFEVLPPEEIVREIAHNLDFLMTQAADVPERQRSLRAIFDTSWRLLTKEEQQAFKRLCIFQGSFSRQAAQEVGGTSLAILLNLANKSWLYQGTNGRYLLHEVLKQYGLERLQADPDEWHNTQEKHAQHFCTFVQQEGKALRTAGQITALEALKNELDTNIPAAWLWLVDQGRLDVLIEKMLPGIFHYELIRVEEGDFLTLVKLAKMALLSSQGREAVIQRAILETFETSIEINLGLTENKPQERLLEIEQQVEQYHLEEELGFWYFVLATAIGGSVDRQMGLRLITELLPQTYSAMDGWERGYYYLSAGQLLERNQGDQKTSYMQQALATFKEIGVTHEQGITLTALADQAAFKLDYELALEYTHMALKFFTQVNDVWGCDYMLNHLGEYYISLGRIDEAFQVYAQVRQFSEKIGNRRMLGVNYSWESIQVSRYGDLERAMELRKKSLEIAVEVANQNDIAWHTWEMGEIYRLMGNLEEARRYNREALAWFERLHDPVGVSFYHRMNGDIALMQGEWEQALKQFETALAHHKQEIPTSGDWGAIYYHARLGTALVYLDAIEEAKQHLKASLSIATNWQLQDIKALPLMGVAALLVKTGYPAQAIDLATCVANHPTTWNEVKAEARKVIEATRQAAPEQEVHCDLECGAGQEISGLCRQYMQSPLLGSS